MPAPAAAAIGGNISHQTVRRVAIFRYRRQVNRGRLHVRTVESDPNSSVSSRSIARPRLHRSPPGVVVPVDRPFFGVMGVAPTPAMGRISASPPGVHTGNIDNKDLVAGTTLFMPVYAVGALFSVGDAHAAQGQGEVDLSAIETGNRGKFQFILRKDLKLTWPRGETPTHWM